MPSSKDCRDSAAECVRLGNEATTAEEQNLFFRMARSWTELAERLEGSGELQARLENVRVQLN